MKNIFKLISKIFAGLLIILISVALIFTWFIKGNSKCYGDNNKTLKVDTETQKKALVIYQPSRGKLTETMAGKIAKGINDSGYEVTINYPGDYLPKDISQYSIVVFGSPVYVGETSSTLAEYMSSIKDISNQKVLLFVTGSQLNNGELDKLEEQLEGKKATEKIGLKDGTDEENKAYEAGRRIVGE